MKCWELHPELKQNFQQMPHAAANTAATLQGYNPITPSQEYHALIVQNHNVINSHNDYEEPA